MQIAGPNADAVHSYMTNGVLVPDAIVSEAVIARLREPDCARAGFVLDHFPATRAQAYALQRAGIVPTKYVYLDLAESGSRARLKSDAATAHLDEAQVSRALAAHSANVNEMVDFYVDLMFYADATLPPAELDARVLEYVRAPTFGVQARVPHRVVLIGPVGAGKTLHAAKLAAFFGVEHISTSQLLRHAAAAHDTADAPAIRQAIAAGRLVPDEYVLPLLKTRLAQYDVRRAGFVLDGCPRTVAQAQVCFCVFEWSACRWL